MIYAGHEPEAVRPFCKREAEGSIPSAGSN